MLRLAKMADASAIAGLAFANAFLEYVTIST